MKQTISIQEIQISTIPFGALVAQWNAYLAGNMLEPVFSFDADGKYNIEGEKVADAEAHGILINKIESLSAGE